MITIILRLLLLCTKQGGLYVEPIFIPFSLFLSFCLCNCLSRSVWSWLVLMSAVKNLVAKTTLWFLPPVSISLPLSVFPVGYVRQIMRLSLLLIVAILWSLLTHIKWWEIQKHTRIMKIVFPDLFYLNREGFLLLSKIGSYSTYTTPIFVDHSHLPTSVFYLSGYLYLAPYISTSPHYLLPQAVHLVQLIMKED